MATYVSAGDAPFVLRFEDATAQEVSPYFSKLIEKGSTVTWNIHETNVYIQNFKLVKGVFITEHFSESEEDEPLIVDLTLESFEKNIEQHLQD